MLTRYRLLSIAAIGGILYVAIFFLQHRVLISYRETMDRERIVVGENDDFLPDAYGLKHADYPYIDWTRGYNVIFSRITEIFDGDTVRDSEGRVIRFLGVNAPEVAHPGMGLKESQKGGDEAKKYAENKIMNQQVLLFVSDEEKRGYYGRILALIFYREKEDWVCLNWQMLSFGLAEPYIFRSDGMIKKEQWLAAWNSKARD